MAEFTASAEDYVDPGAVRCDVCNTGFEPRNPRPPRTIEEREAGWNKPMLLSDAMRNVLVRTAEHWGDEMIETIKRRRADGYLSVEREDSMIDEADLWFELAESLRKKRGVK